MRVPQPPRPRRVSASLVASAVATTVLAACGRNETPAGAGTAAGATADAPAAATQSGGQAVTGTPVNPTSLNPGGSLRRDTTGAPYDATAADSVERNVAASATGETNPAITGGNSGMQLPGTVPISQVGGGLTMTQRDAGGDRYAGGVRPDGKLPAASAFIGRDGRAYYTDAAGRILSESEIRGRQARTATAAGNVATGGMPSGAMIATGSVAAYQPNAPDAPGAAARNGSPVSAAPGTQSGATTALSPNGAVDRNVAWGGASPEVAAKLARGTALAPNAPAYSDSAAPTSAGGPVNPAVPNAVLAPIGPNARALALLIANQEIAAARAGEQRLTTASFKAFAAKLARDYQAQINRSEQIPGQAALTDAQRAAIGRALNEQATAMRNLQGGGPNFDTQWISARTATLEQGVNQLRALAPQVPAGPQAAFIAQLTAATQANLLEAQRLQSGANQKTYGPSKQTPGNVAQ